MLNRSPISLAFSIVENVDAFGIKRINRIGVRLARRA